MADRIGARELLWRARDMYDAPDNLLASGAARAWRSLFHSGGLWMKAALEHVRGASMPGSARSLQTLGFVKYALASLGALAPVALGWQLGEPLFLLGCVPVFYAIEAQFVFLFPLALD